MGRRNRNSFLLSPEWILMLKWWIYLNHVCFQMKWHQWDPRNRGSTFKTVVDFLLESPGVRGRCPGRWWQRPRAASPVPQPWVFGLQEDPLTWSPWPRPHVYPQSILRALAWLTCTFSPPLPKDSCIGAHPPTPMVSSWSDRISRCSASREPQDGLTSTLL